MKTKVCMTCGKKMKVECFRKLWCGLYSQNCLRCEREASHGKEENY